MEIGDKMGSLSRYSKLVIDHKLRQIAETVVKINRSPLKAILEAAMVVNVPIEIVSGVLNEVALNELFDFGKKKADAKPEHDWRRGIGQGASNYDDYMKDAYKRYVASLDQEARAKKPAPAASPVVAKMASAVDGSVEQLTSMLKEIVQKLSDKHGLGDEQITQLFNQALRSLRTTDIGQGIGSPSISLKGFTAPPDNTGAFTPFSADTGSYAGAGDFGKSFDFGAEMGPEEQEPDSEPDQEEDVPNPTWYDRMTKAEKSWFDKLSNPLKKRFIGMHDRKVGGDKEDPTSGVSVGDLDIPPGTTDHDAISKIAYYMNERRKKAGQPEYQDAMQRAAGLWNRHKIRKKMMHSRSGRTQNNLPKDFDADAMLGMDHHKVRGNILNEWCRLAGIEEKPRKRSR